MPGKCLGYSLTTTMPQDYDKPEEAIWKPLTGLPYGAEQWVSPVYDNLVTEWHDLYKLLTDKSIDKTILDIWLRERRRAFAIETGQIEGLYTLKRGVTEQLITEGLEGVVSSHTEENIDDKTIKGLLRDQETAMEMVFRNIKDKTPLTHATVKAWHKHITHHQGTVTGIKVIDGQPRRIPVPFESKGEYKTTENNPFRDDGILFEYCPWEHVESEMTRLFSLYEEIRDKNLPTHVEAAWLHHRFVRTHPFQDGNGRVSRLLMAYVYIRKNEVPPLIRAEEKGLYIRALERADKGNLMAFSEHLRILATEQIENTIVITKDILSGAERLHHPNGGTTDKTGYHPPEKDDIEYGSDREPGT